MRHLSGSAQATPSRGLAPRKPRRARFVLAGLTLLAFLALTLVGCGLLKRPKRGYGEDCLNPADCESNNCAFHGAFCSRACTYDRDCAKGHVCRSDGSAAGNSCSKAVGATVGGGCAKPEGCASGHCLKKKLDEPGLCSRYCLTPADCPAGMKICDKISNTGLLKMCLPGAAPAATTPPATPPRGGKRR